SKTMAKNVWTADEIPDQSGRTVVITGATSGIGKEAARVLAGKNAKVIIGARNMEKADTAIAEICSEFSGADILARPIDLSDLKSVNTFALNLKTDLNRLDVLINNAGIMMCPYAETADGFEIQFGTNHLGHFSLTGLLLPLLTSTQESRIVVVSSMAHKAGQLDLADLNWKNRTYNKTRAYSDSKLANLYFALELAQRLEEFDSTPLVTAAHPGWTATELQRHSGVAGFLNNFFAQRVEQGALPTLRAGFDDGVQPGDYFGPSGLLEMQGHPVKVSPNAKARDQMIARELWRLSEEMTDVSVTVEASRSSIGQGYDAPAASESKP
ncbi:MAG: oxidoreductase, partial [Methyloligellaceae bacterium]